MQSGHCLQRATIVCLIISALAGNPQNVGAQTPTAETPDSPLVAPACTWTSPQPEVLSFASQTPTVTPLADGTVVLSGGTSYWDCEDCCRYQGEANSVYWLDPTGTVRAHADLQDRRTEHTATELTDGRVLIVGGYFEVTACEQQQKPGKDWTDCCEEVSKVFARTEIYAPAENTVTEGPSPAQPRYCHTATRLADGRVLIAGGLDASGAAADAEIYDPTDSSWRRTASPEARLCQASSLLLPDGRVLVAGGESATPDTASTAVYLFDPIAETWTAGPSLQSGRQRAWLGLAPDQSVLAIGGLKYPSGGATLERWGLDALAWTPIGSLGTDPRAIAFATPLPDGQWVMVNHPGSLLIVDPVSGASTQSDLGSVYCRAATVLGATSAGVALLAGCRTRESYTPTLMAPLVWDPSIATIVASAPWQDRPYRQLVDLGDGRLMVLGGTDLPPAILSPATDADHPAVWTTHEPGALAEGISAARLADGRVLLVGGAGTGEYDEWDILNAVVFDPRTDDWQPITPPPTERNTHTIMPLADGGALLVGGFVGYSEWADSILRIDAGLSTWTTAATLLHHHAAPSATVLRDGRVLVAGGGDGPQADSAVAFAERCDLTTGICEEIPPMSIARMGHTDYLASDGRVWLLGGTGGWGSPPQGTADVYDPAANTWMTQMLPFPVNAPAIQPLAGDRLLIADHCIGPFNLGVLNLPTLAWQPLAEAPAELMLDRDIEMFMGALGDDALLLSAHVSYEGTQSWVLTCAEGSLPPR